MVYRRPDGDFYTGLTPPSGAERLGIWYPRTGTLGGCAMHNGAVVSLPSNADWDYVAGITGDDGWLSTNMRPHFVKLERNADILVNDTSHGFNGWLDISLGDTTWVNTTADTVALAAKAATLTGYSPSQLSELMNRDINSAEPKRDQTLGIFGSWSHSTKSGQRSSPGYYVKETVAEGKYPLTLQLNSLVTKVLFDSNKSDKPRAIGVEYLHGEFLYGADPRYDADQTGTVGKAYASKEVIIAGGAFNSPQMLMLSGIGPKEELERFSIPLLVDSPGGWPEP